MKININKVACVPPFMIYLLFFVRVSVKFKEKTGFLSSLTSNHKKNCANTIRFNYTGVQEFNNEHDMVSLYQNTAYNVFGPRKTLKESQREISPVLPIHQQSLKFKVVHTSTCVIGHILKSEVIRFFISDWPKIFILSQ